ncbi:MAG TPA: hypothetical protein VF137_04315 [Candidatus Dormibacteraeota bacterium]
MSSLARRLAALGVMSLAAGWFLALPASAAYPQDPPNDPGYASAENDPTCAQHYVGSEQYYLYSSMPRCAPLASDPENASGMSVDKAWAQYSTGNPHTVIAYVEGGINWQRDQPELVDKVYLNWRELPVPCTGNPCTLRYGGSEADYDVNHDGVFNAADYAHDPRVSDANGNGWIDPEDIITAFSCYDRFHDSLGALTHPDPASPTGYDCSNGAQTVDNDGNGYPHDISGWDFYDHQNDPATYDSQYGHSDNQMKQAAAQTNNGVQGAGVCPQCLILPVKAGAEALDRTDDLAQAWLFAADSGASVIVSVTADLGYSSFMHQAVENIWRRGIVMAESSNDFDSTDHQGGMWWPFVLPGNGLVPNMDGADKAPGPPTLAANAGTISYRERSDLTSWGTHAMFSVPNEGGSTSESTPTVGGMMALVIADGRRLSPALSGPEAVQLVRATASPITDPTLNWPGSPGDWNLQYGYGRPNVYKAMQAIAAGSIPPVGWIDSPDWFSLYDPTITRYVPITGHVEANRSPGYRWQLEYGLGPQPQTWTAISSGSGSSPEDGTLGRLDLSQIPKSFWSAPYQMSKTKSLESTEQYTVTLKLVVTDAANRTGIDRRTIDVVHDPSWLPGFPLRLGHGGDSQPALADLQGTGRLDIVFGDSDGVIHAIDPVTGHELPGWPAHTAPVVVQKSHRGISPGDESVFAPAAVGDLDHDGHLWVVVTSSAGQVYVFDAAGRPRPGWPKTMATGVQQPTIPRPQLPMTRLPQQGAADSPVLYDLTGKGPLQIIQSAWDGYIHIWNPDGSSFSDIQVQRPPDSELDPCVPGQTCPHWINDHKLESSPVVANLTGAGPDLVIRSQWTETTSTGDIQPGGAGFLHAYKPDGTLLWIAKMPSIIEYYGSAQEFITEGVGGPVAANVLGDGQFDVAANPGFSPTYLFHGDGSNLGLYGPVPGPTAAALAGSVELGSLPVDAPIGFTTSGAFGNLNGVLSYTQPGSGGGSLAYSLLLPGSGGAITEYERAWTAAGGAPQPGFPAPLQGLDFLGTPAIADITGDGQPDILQGADSSALMGYTTGGQQAPGFPKFNTGWSVFAPAVGDLTDNGRNDVVELTREGYVFAWSTPGLATANSEWWTYRHDEHRTNQYGIDTRPPGAIRNLAVHGGNITFTDPGGDWYTGAAAHLLVNGASVPVKGPAGTADSVAVPAGAATVTIQAVDAAGNLGLPATVQLGHTNRQPAPPEAPPTRASAGGSPRAALKSAPFAGGWLVGSALAGGLVALCVSLWRRRPTS